MTEQEKKQEAEKKLRAWYKDHFIHLDDDKERGEKINKALEDSFINRAKKGTL